MAEKSISKSKNQQFLQKFEHQRLNKLCNRAIDLRGKVAGECQAYTFGDKTHYLDDRAYLLAKQLLEHFNGQYTIGVYESILKALKSLSPSNHIDQTPSLQDKQTEVQLLSFNNKLHREEPRITYATPIALRVADVLYHGTTIDITSSAINISLKRSYTLDEGDEVSITFSELGTNQQTSLLLSKIPFTILKIEHDELRSQLVLVRNRDDNDKLTQWLDRWSQHYSTGEHLDIDDQVFNLNTQFYLRLYYQTLNSAIFWLNPLDIENPIKAFQMNQLAENALQNTAGLDLTFLPFDNIIAEGCDFLLLTLADNSSSKHYLIHRDDPQEIAKLLDWHSQQTSSQVFLIQTHNTSVDLDNFEPEIELVASSDESAAHTLKQRLAGISQIVTISNITNSCQHLSQATALKEPQQQDTAWSGFIPEPTIFKHHIQRENQRFAIRTNIRLHSPHENRLFNIVTTDVSDTGLLISLPGHVDLKIGSRVSIDFERWQGQTKKVNLTKLPYIIRNHQFRSGASHFGLERELYSCDIDINKFFSTVIEENKEQLVESNTDVLISQETQIFSSLLAHQLTTIPFYLAIDGDNKRYLQAVSVPKSGAKHNTELWLEIQKQILSMSQLLNDSSAVSSSFGLYCYQDKLDTWKIQADYSLTTTVQKSFFINQAIHHEKHAFYHCTLTPVTPALIEQEADLNQNLLQLRPRSPHKIKQVRETLHSLFAVGELIDITDIISSSQN